MKEPRRWVLAAELLVEADGLSPVGLALPTIASMAPAFVEWPAAGGEASDENIRVEVRLFRHCQPHAEAQVIVVT